MNIFKRKRIRSAAAAAAALSLSLLLAACGAAAPAPSAPLSTSPAAESPAAGSPPAESTAGTAGDAAVTPGTWLSDKGQYYFFDENGKTGRTSSLSDGTGAGFEYSVSGGEADFSIGGAGSSSKCTVSRDEDSITLEWADGVKEQLSFVSELGSDEFKFYTNDELASMALSYYKSNSGEPSDGLLSAAEANADGSVTVQIYRSLGDHNSTAEWYTLDRITASGTDSAGNPVELA